MSKRGVLRTGQARKRGGGVLGTGQVKKRGLLACHRPQMRVRTYSGQFSTMTYGKPHQGYILYIYGHSIMYI